MAIDIFMVLQSKASGSIPITADPTLDQYYKTTFPGSPAFEIRSFSLDVENPTTLGSATGGAGVGKIKLNELSIEKSVDTLSPSLYKVSAVGAHFDKMQVFFRRTGGASPAPKPYLMYGFNLGFITKIDWSASEGDELPVERVTFAYGSLVLAYYPQTTDGKFLAMKMASWNQTTNNETVPIDVSTGF